MAGEKKAEGFNWKGCGICCFIFSVFAMLFLGVVAAVIKSKSQVINISEEARDGAVHNLSMAVVIYAAFVVISIGCIYKGTRKPAEEATRLVDRKEEESTTGGRWA